MPELATTTKIRGRNNGSEILNTWRRAEDEKGGFEKAEGAYDGTEPLECQVWPGADRAVVVTLPVRWYDAAEGAVEIDYPQDAMATLDVGSYTEAVVLAGENVEIARRILRVVDGPGTAQPRVVYHTYKQLLDEKPDIDSFAVALKDETGFNDTAGRARDWIDGEILDAARGRCGGCWPRFRAAYADALAADGLDLTTIGGRRLSEASVFYTLSIILRRARGVVNESDGYLELAGDYERRAKEILSGGVTASFLSPPHDLRSVRLGGITFGRLER